MRKKISSLMMIKEFNELTFAYIFRCMKKLWLAVLSFFTFLISTFSF